MLKNIGIKPPIKLFNKDLNLGLYIYDKNSIDIDLYRKENILTIGLAYSTEDENSIIEKISAISQIFSTDLISTLKPKVLPFAINTALGRSDFNIDQEGLMHASLSIIAQTNKLINVKVPNFYSFIKNIQIPETKTYDTLQKLIFELSNYIPPEYFDFVNQILTGDKSLNELELGWTE